jgi:hypothetical protein
MPQNNHPREVLYIGPPPVNRLGRRGLWTSLFGLATCGLLSPLGLLMSFLALKRQPRTAASFGLVLGLIGSLWVAFLGSLVVSGAVAASARHEAMLERQTRTALVQAEGVIEHYRSETGRLPEGIAGNKLVLTFADAWNSALRYDLDDSHYFIRSAGPDRKFDTKDDVVGATHLAGGKHVVEAN